MREMRGEVGIKNPKKEMDNPSFLTRFGLLDNIKKFFFNTTQILEISLYYLFSLHIGALL